MGKRFSWSKVLPVLGAGLMVAGIMSFAGSASSSAHDRGNWNGDTKYFLKLAGVPGDSTDSKHQGEIELESYRFLEDETDQQTTVTADAGFGDNNLRFLADASSASPLLFSKAASGDHLTDATLTVRKGKTQKEYLVYKMTDLVISSYQTYGNGDKDPLDEVVIDYATLEVSHTDTHPVKKGWSFRNKAAL